MRKNDLTKSVFAALLLVSTVAGAEDKYPASDFQPKVVYQDDAVTSGAASAPAAPVASSSSASGSDSQYPAANFEPKVLYSDADYKHSDSAPGSAASSSSSSVESSTSSSAAPQAAKDESSIGYLLGLIFLGIAGFVLFKKGAGLGGTAGNSKASSVAAKAAGGLTGVARYMLKSSGTGVSRYLEKNAKSTSAGNATGVAKYLASHSSSATSAVSKAATGVEKYMRNKG